MGGSVGDGRKAAWVGLGIDGDNALRSRGNSAICFVFSRDIFWSWGGRIGGGPAFEMLSDLPEITKPVSDGTGFSTQTFLLQVPASESY